MIDPVHARDFLPAFARVDAPSKGATGNYQPLGLSVGKLSGSVYRVAPLEQTETTVASYAVGIRALGSADDDGLPPALSPHATFEFRMLFDTYGALTITNRRLLGMGYDGNSALGPLNGDHWLVFAMPLIDVWAVQVTRGKGALGRPKDKGLLIESFAPVCALEVPVISGRVSAGRTKASPRDVADEVCRAACDARLEQELEPPERTRVEEVKRGSREEEADKTTAWIRAPWDEAVDGTGGIRG